MYEYKFLKINLKTTFKETKPEEDYRDVIENNAKEGWRLVQIFAPPIVNYGSADHYELIFEKKK